MSPAEKFVTEMLGRIRREFYSRQEKRFFQERRQLIQAITWPARWMNERGIQAPASIYRRILETVMAAIRSHAGEIDRFGFYFLHCVQQRMTYHGEQYYYEAKAAKPIASVLPAALRQARSGRPVDMTTDFLAQLERLTRSRGGRRRANRGGRTQLDLLPTSAGRKTGAIPRADSSSVQPTRPDST